MTNYVKDLAKIGVGYAVGKIVAASNGDENLLSDQNVNNGITGYLIGLYGIPKAKETLDELVKSASNGERPNLRRVARYAAVGSVAAGLVYAFENGAYEKISGSVKNLYDKAKKSELKT